MSSRPHHRHHRPTGTIDPDVIPEGNGDLHDAGGVHRANDPALMAVAPTWRLDARRVAVRDGERILEVHVVGHRRPTTCTCGAARCQHLWRAELCDPWWLALEQLQRHGLSSERLAVRWRVLMERGVRVEAAMLRVIAAAGDLGQGALRTGRAM